MVQPSYPEAWAEGRALAPLTPPPHWRKGQGWAKTVTKFPRQPRGAITSLSPGFGTCPLAAISMATRSGSSLGKWDTSFHDDEWEEPN